jgi:hypothetical protein
MMYSKWTKVFQMTAVAAELWIQKLLGHIRDSLEEWTLFYLRHLELIWKFLCRLPEEWIPSVWWPRLSVHSTRKGFISLVFNLPAERFIIYILLHSINHCYKNLVLFCFYGIESAALPTVANSLCNVFHCSGNTSTASIILAI